jgi:hypothetical protein
VISACVFVVVLYEQGLLPTESRLMTKYPHTVTVRRTRVGRHASLPPLVALCSGCLARGSSPAIASFGTRPSLRLELFGQSYAQKLVTE